MLSKHCDQKKMMAMQHVGLVQAPRGLEGKVYPSRKDHEVEGPDTCELLPPLPHTSTAERCRDGDA